MLYIGSFFLNMVAGRDTGWKPVLYPGNDTITFVFNTNISPAPKPDLKYQWLKLFTKSTCITAKYKSCMFSAVASHFFLEVKFQIQTLNAFNFFESKYVKIAVLL